MIFGGGAISTVVDVRGLQEKSHALALLGANEMMATAATLKIVTIVEIRDMLPPDPMRR